MDRAFPRQPKSMRILGPAIYTVGPYINELFVTTPDDVERADVRAFITRLLRIDNPDTA